MVFRGALALLILFALGGCTKFFDTGEPIVDQLAYRIHPFANCMVLLPAPSLDKKGGSLLAMSNEQFTSKSVRAAIIELAVNPPPIDKRPPSVFGNAKADECMFKITRPLIYGDTAFVEYGTRAGPIGAYALEKRNTQWEIAESLELGYW